MDVIKQSIKLHLLPFSKIYYLLQLLSQKKEDAIKPPNHNYQNYRVLPKIKCSDIILMHSIAHNWLLWTILIYFYLTPHIEDAKMYQIGWVSKIIARDLFMMAFTFGGWHWVLYSDSSPFKKRVQKDKLTQKYPTKSQVWHDVKGTVSSIVISSIMDIHILHLYANGVITYNPDIQSQLFRFVLAIQSYFYIREVYFYMQHRPLHPWKTKKIPDFGKYLYKYVHYYHHKSWNPGPWDGLSLHPIQGFLNCFVCYFPLLICSHPFIFLYYKYCVIFSAVKSHDGFGYPAGFGNLFHEYHHQKFEVNFGGDLVPFDYWFGEFYDGNDESQDENLDEAKVVDGNVKSRIKSINQILENKQNKDSQIMANKGS